ncbi:monocarboxylate transporter 13-like [Mercenaria mercenaria]|uniref:monocarboxylate transporter 13-like n=1 Tax=Mercenaria mercenaria TaxID=6596 RepID=UPI00234E8475|nr:monocarboxylate transporter 13-like [Mercenaria mercenaria]
MQNLLMSFASLVNMTVGMQFMSNRMSIMLGAIILTISHIISANATDISMLFASIGFLEGIGTALVHPPVTATIGEYFHKRRGLANGLAFSGASFGGLIFAPIFSALFDDYGYSGTFMIVAGMTFNILVTGALLRPIKSFERQKSAVNQKDKNTKHINEVGNTKELEELLSVKDNTYVIGSSNSVENGVQSERNKTDMILTQLVLEKENGHLGVLPNKAILQLRTGDASSKIKIVRSDSYQQRSDTNTMSGSPLLPRSRAWSLGNRQGTRTASQNSHKGLSPLNSLVESLSRSRVALYSSADGVCGSVIDIQEIPLERSEGNKNKDTKTSFLSKLKASFDVNLFKSVLFPVFLLMAAMLAPTSGLLPLFLAPLSKDLGLSAEQTGLLMAIIGGVGMSSRILCALFADRKFVKLTTLLAVVSTLAGVTAHCARIFKTFPSLVVMAVLLGLCCEIYQSMYPVILVEYLTLPKLKSCIGFTLLCHGLAVAATFPVVGALRDSTGNYYASYHFLGTMSFVGALLALSLPHVHKRQHTEVEV